MTDASVGGLVEKWRTKAINSNRGSSNAYARCADQLEAALMSCTPTEAPKGSSDKLMLNAYGRTCYDAGKEAALTAGGWQDISTAPEDTRVLVAMKRGGLLFGCLLWIDDKRVWTDDETGEAIAPTLWMPLPSAPTETK